MIDVSGLACARYLMKKLMVGGEKDMCCLVAIRILGSRTLGLGYEGAFGLSFE